jgi:putative phosphoesterase
LKIALISDIHANLIALEAVLKHARKHGVDEIWNLGDSIGYGAFPDQVIRRLQSEKILSIVGNYDLKVLKINKKRAQWKKTKHPLKLAMFEWTYQQLSKKSRKIITEFPRELTLKRKGCRLLLTHASPASIDEPLFPETPKKRFAELARTVDVEMVLCGHSHIACVRTAKGVSFANPGSVGRAKFGDPRASYAQIVFTKGSARIDHFLVEYDLSRAANAIRSAGLPEVFGQMVIQGVDFDDVVSRTKNARRGQG